MKFSVRLSAIAALLAAVVSFTGCKDAEPGKGGTIPPAWDEPGTPRVDSMGGTDKGADWKPEDKEVPSSWGAGANDGVLDERTGVRRLEVAGFPKIVYFGYDTDRIGASELSKVAEAADFPPQWHDVRPAHGCTLRYRVHRSDLRSPAPYRGCF